MRVSPLCPLSLLVSLAWAVFLRNLKYYSWINPYFLNTIKHFILRLLSIVCVCVYRLLDSCTSCVTHPSIITSLIVYSRTHMHTHSYTLPLFLSVSLSLSVCLSVCLCLSLFVCVCVCLISPPFSLSLSLPPFPYPLSPSWNTPRTRTYTLYMHNSPH